MLHELGQAVYNAKLEWKASSLEFMACGSTPSLGNVLTIKINEVNCTYKEVERLEVLGSILDASGSTFESWTHRREKAEGKYYANLGTLRSRGSLQCRIRAWIGAPVASALLGAETWHLTAGVLHNARTWEMKKLRHMFRMKFKPGEGQLEYNTRTSARIKAWFNYYHQDFIHTRILRSVFKAAWGEPRMKVGSEYPLKIAREVRSSLWWEFVKHLSSKRRRTEGLSQASSGHIAAWEDCFVSVYGSDWRAFRDTHDSLEAWMCNFSEFSQFLCDLWGLPAQNGTGGVDLWTPLNEKRDYHLEDMPMPDLPEWCYDFATSSCRISFFVDCQTAANLINGFANLKGDQYDPLLRRSTRRLRDFWKQGWMPRKDHDNYVVWIPRECNGPADFLCNLALQERQDHDWVDALADTPPNLLVMSDGGFKNGQGAVAWIVYAVSSGTLCKLHHTCRYIPVATSAFQCEMIALEEAIAKVSSLINYRRKYLRTAAPSQ